MGKIKNQIVMKTFVVVLVAFFALTSCNIMKKIAGSKDERAVDLSDKKEEVKKEESKSDKKDDVKKDEGTNEIVMKDFDRKDIPSDVKFQGKITGGKRWSDKNGDNIILLTVTDEHKSSKKDIDGIYMNSKELYAYQYVNKSGSWSQLWKVSDFIGDCDADLTLKHINNSLSVTDLNNNGIGESTFLYCLSCRSDVSPAGLKLIMHEGDTKYALRGSMRLFVDGGWQGGEFSIDKSFDDAPDGFLNYAKDQWKKFREEKLN